MLNNLTIKKKRKWCRHLYMHLPYNFFKKIFHPIITQFVLNNFQSIHSGVSGRCVCCPYDLFWNVILIPARLEMIHSDVTVLVSRDSEYSIIFFFIIVITTFNCSYDINYNKVHALYVYYIVTYYVPYVFTIRRRDYVVD